MSERLLDVSGLTTRFHTEDGTVTAVNDFSFHLDRGESLCIVGESGCGKSVSSMSIMRLLKVPPAEIIGDVTFNGKKLLELPEEEMREIRGNEIAMIFQEPMTSLNPVFTCGFQISEALKLHQGMDKSAAKARSIELMRMVGIPLPEKRFHDFPHQFSGGMRQRVMIAMALACNPKLLIADEPTTALDVTIQAQIMDLIRDLKQKMNMALILITHDMGVVAEMAERVIVMYAGKAVEEAEVKALFRSPLHPYTQGLLASIPRLDSNSDEDLTVIEGTVPSMFNMPKGCPFAPRCQHCMGRCEEEMPELTDLGNGHRVRCFLQEDMKGARTDAEAE